MISISKKSSAGGAVAGAGVRVKIFETLVIGGRGGVMKLWSGTLVLSILPLRETSSISGGGGVTVRALSSSSSSMMAWNGLLTRIGVDVGVSAGGMGEVREVVGIHVSSSAIRVFFRYVVNY